MGLRDRAESMVMSIALWCMRRRWYWACDRCVFAARRLGGKRWRP